MRKADLLEGGALGSSAISAARTSMSYPPSATPRDLRLPMTRPIGPMYLASSAPSSLVNLHDADVVVGWRQVEASLRGGRVARVVMLPSTSPPTTARPWHSRVDAGGRPGPRCAGRPGLRRLLLNSPKALHPDLDAEELERGSGVLGSVLRRRVRASTGWSTKRTLAPRGPRSSPR